MRNRILLALVVGGGFAVCAVALLLSDRAPAIASQTLDAVFAVGRRVDQLLGFELVTRDQIPGTRDEVGHALLWGSGTFALGMLLRRHVPILGLAGFMLALSVASEFAQREWTSSRSMSMADAVANAFGVVGATVAVVVLGGIMDGVAQLWRRFRAGADRPISVT